MRPSDCDFGLPVLCLAKVMDVTSVFRLKSFTSHYSVLQSEVNHCRKEEELKQIVELYCAVKKIVPFLISNLFSHLRVLDYQMNLNFRDNNMIILK